MAERGEDAATQASDLPQWLSGRAVATEQVSIVPEDRSLVALFFALDTQWHHHPLAGVRMGINYAAITPTAEIMGISMTPAMLFDLRIMESAALSAFARKARR